MIVTSEAVTPDLHRVRLDWKAEEDQHVLILDLAEITTLRTHLDEILEKSR